MTTEARPRTVLDVAREHRTASGPPPRSRMRRLGRRTAIVLVGVLGSFMLFTGTSNAAWVWDWKDNASSYILNFCNPSKVPTLSTFRGVDNALGLNQVAPAGARDTYVMPPYTEGEKVPEKSVDKLARDGFGPSGTGQPTGDWVSGPSYLRYGFSALGWDNYNLSCFDDARWLGSVANIVLFILHFTVMMMMAFLHHALGNALYEPFAALISPFTSAFGILFKPWIGLFAVMIGVPWVWIKNQGSTQKLLGAAAWVIAVTGLFVWFTDSPGKVTRFSNNFVSAFASEAAAQMFAAGNMDNAACNRVKGVKSISDSANTQGAGGSTDPYSGWNNILNGSSAGGAYASDTCVLESLWYGLSYQTWLSGELGINSYTQERWGPAVLNARYVGEDTAGMQMTVDANAWNNASYADNGDGTKTKLWTEDDQWNKVNYLRVVAAMCGSTEDVNSKGGNGDLANNAWIDAGCAPADLIDQTAYTAFTGVDYKSRFIVATVGLFNAILLMIAIGFLALYLMVIKMSFFFLLVLAPFFLAVGAFPAEGPRATVKVFLGTLAGNVMKQAVAVCVLLFISYAFALLLAPNGFDDLVSGANLGGGTAGLPYMLKPLYSLAFLFGLVLLYRPVKKALIGAAKGDPKVVDNAMKAPKNATKKIGKAAVVAATAASTGGAALGAVGGKAAAMTALKGAGTTAATALKTGGVKGLIGAGAKFASSENGQAVLNTAMNMSKTKSAAGKGIALAKGLMDFTAAKSATNIGTASSDGPGFAVTPPTGDGVPVPGAPTPGQTPGTPAAGQPGPNGGTPATGQNPGAGPAPQPVTVGKTSSELVAAAKAHVTGPDFKDTGVTTDVAQSGDQLISSLKLSTSEDPAQQRIDAAASLGTVMEQVYAPAPGRMDPTHPATVAIQQYMANTAADPDAAAQQIQVLVADHGLPSMINAIGQSEPTGVEGWQNIVVGGLPVFDTPMPSGAARIDAAADLGYLQQVVPITDPMASFLQAYRDNLLDTSQSVPPADQLYSALGYAPVYAPQPAQADHAPVPQYDDVPPYDPAYEPPYDPYQHGEATVTHHQVPVPGVSPVTNVVQVLDDAPADGHDQTPPTTSSEVVSGASDDGKGTWTHRKSTGSMFPIASDDEGGQ